MLNRDKEIELFNRLEKSQKPMDAIGELLEMYQNEINKLFNPVNPFKAMLLSIVFDNASKIYASNYPNRLNVIKTLITTIYSVEGVAIKMPEEEID